MKDREKGCNLRRTFYNKELFMKKITLVLCVLLALTFMIPLSAQRYRGKNPFLRELKDVQEYKEKMEKAKKPRTKARYAARLKKAEQELAAALKEELAVLDEFIKKEEEKMKPYKENIEKLEAEKKRLKALAATGSQKEDKNAKGKDSKKADDDGVMGEEEEESGKKSKNKKSSKKKKSKSSKKK